MSYPYQKYLGRERLCKCAGACRGSHRKLCVCKAGFESVKAAGGRQLGMVRRGQGFLVKIGILMTNVLSVRMGVKLWAIKFG